DDEEIASPSAPKVSSGTRAAVAQRGSMPNGPATVNSPVAHAVTNFAPAAGVTRAMSSPSLASHPGPLAKVCPECGLHYPAEFKVCPRDAVELNEIDAEVEQDELLGQTLG